MILKWTTAAASLIAANIAGVCAQDTTAGAPAAPASEALQDQDAAAPNPLQDIDRIVVEGVRRAGITNSVFAPELTYDENDIASLGASSFADILAALSPQTGSGRGRSSGPPAVLLNGRRIAGFRELRNYPPEALQRVEVLSEDAALKFGFRADQRVINFILKDEFKSFSVEPETSAPTEGGRRRFEGDLGRLWILKGRRFNADLEYVSNSPLLESERSVVRGAPDPAFDALGNVVASTPGDEIDPALSGLAGEIVTIAGAPDAAADGAVGLNAFVPGANEARFTDLTEFRSLTPDREQIELNLGVNAPLGPVTMTATADGTFANRLDFLGLADATLALPEANAFSPFGEDVLVNRYVGGALERETDTRELEGAVTLSSAPGPFNWTVINSASLTDEDRTTETGFDPAALQGLLDANDPIANPFGSIASLGALTIETSESRNLSTQHTALLNAPLLQLPAGDLSGSFTAQYRITDQETEVVNDLGLAETDLYRGRATGQASFEIPVLDDSREGPARIGEVSFNVNAAIDDYSDFGTLWTYGGGVVWSPVEALRATVSYNFEEGPPSISQLGDPVIATPNIDVFDFTTGVNAVVTRTTGGNPDLRSDERQVLNLGLRLQPLGNDDLTIIADWTRTETDDPISSFPTPTAEIEAAFPDRFTRDADGVLIALDARPINYQSSEREQIRWGVNYSKRLQPSRPGGARGGGRPSSSGRPASGGGARPQRGGPPAQASAPAQGRAPEGQNGQRPPERSGGEQDAGAASGQQQPQNAQGGQSGGRSGGGRSGGGRRPAGGRLYLSAYHTVVLEDLITIDSAAPRLDLLNGSAVGSNGGTSRHSLEAVGGIFYNGLGTRVNADWRSRTEVLLDPLSGVPSDEDLFFSDLFTMDVRLFADL
ncbi:MAG: hypothetical protein AAFR11_09395, partial [Pseudomonadota bacterium]